jgi:hypothetical protein
MPLIEQLPEFLGAIFIQDRITTLDQGLTLCSQQTSRLLAIVTGHNTFQSSNRSLG